MEESKNLKELTAKVYNDILNTLYLLEILEEIVDGDRKEDFLVLTAKNNIHNTFDNIEHCRKLISTTD